LVPTSASHYFAGTIRGAERVGVDADMLLENVGLTREQVFDPQWRGDVALLARLVQLLWYALDDEFMGYIATPAKLGTFAMMAYSVIDSVSLHAALRKGILFYSLFTDAIEMSLEESSGGSRFTLSFAEPELDPDNYFIEFWMTIWYRLLGWLANGLPPLTEVTFVYPVPDTYVTELKHIFRCPFVFDAAFTSISFDSAFLKQPIVRDRRELKKFLAAAPLGVMMSPADETSLARQIRTNVLGQRRLPLDFPTLDELAGQMAMTEQTLRRKLRQESTSYREIKEEIRREIAVQKLIGSRMSVQEIAFLVGYSEARAFTRAFHQWTGNSPAQYREKLREQFKR
jgi:AraC-like DNA-binding protein